MNSPLLWQITLIYGVPSVLLLLSMYWTLFRAKARMEAEEGGLREAADFDELDARLSIEREINSGVSRWVMVAFLCFHYPGFFIMAFLGAITGQSTMNCLLVFALSGGISIGALYWLLN